MTRKLITKYGEVELRAAMFDQDGTNLIEGVEIVLDGELAGEAHGISFSQVSDLGKVAVEQFMQDHCQYL